MIDSLDLDAVFRCALKNGGEFADIFFETGSFTSIVLDDDRIERVLTGTDRGIGLRLVAGYHTAYAYTNDISHKGLISLAETVSQALKSGHESVINRSVKAVAQWFNPLIPSAEVPLTEKIGIVSRTNSYARTLDPLIRQVMVVYRDSTSTCQCASSGGSFVEWNRGSTLFVVQAVASDGTTIQTGYEPAGEIAGFELFQKIPPESVADRAVKRAVLMLKARKAPGGMMPVVLSSEAGGTMIHEAIGHGLEADLVQNGMSVYRGKIGEQVASPLVSVIDDATLPFRRGSFPYDDEGVPGQKSVLVENGILKGYLYDRTTALKDSVPSTGNGRRESYQSKPIVRMSNTYIAPGSDSPEAIVASVTHGLFVRKMGGGQVNTVTGDFVFEVSEGYRIENGTIGEPVRGATLTGNGPEILKKISRVGSDLGFGIGTCGKEGQGVPVADAQPTLLIDTITVG